LELYWNRWPRANVGIVLGRVSRLIGLDIDGPEAFDLLKEILPQKLPTTLEFKTPGGGKRLLFTIPPTLVVPKKRWDRGSSHLIVLGEGSYTVMPPSIHANGKVYQ
jgi:hypothetical protein